MDGRMDGWTHMSCEMLLCAFQFGTVGLICRYKGNRTGAVTSKLTITLKFVFSLSLSHSLRSTIHGLASFSINFAKFRIPSIGSHILIPNTNSRPVQLQALTKIRVPVPGLPPIIPISPKDSKNKCFLCNIQ